MLMIGNTLGSTC